MYSIITISIGNVRGTFTTIHNNKHRLFFRFFPLLLRRIFKFFFVFVHISIIFDAIDALVTRLTRLYAHIAESLFCVGEKTIFIFHFSTDDFNSNNSDFDFH